MAESFLWEQLFWRWNFCIFWHQSWIIFIWWFLITVSFTVSSNYSWRFGNIFCSDFRYVLLNWSNCDFENIKMVLWSWWHIYQIKGRVISNHAFKGEVGFRQWLAGARILFHSSFLPVLEYFFIIFTSARIFFHHFYQCYEFFQFFFDSDKIFADQDPRGR